MSLLTISGLTLRMGGRTLLDRADLAVDAGRRIGLVGRNGAGKSTLLRANRRRTRRSMAATSASPPAPAWRR